MGARGRGRKIQAEGLPANFAKLPLTQRRRILQSQRAAELYKKSKIVAAIKTHLADDEDRYSATAAVLALATAQYRDSGQEPPWIVMEEIRSETLAPVLLALEGSDPATCRGQNRFNDSNLSTSIVAHSRPLRLVELQLIGDIFRSRIRCLQMVRIEGSAQKMAQAGRLDHDAMPVDDRVAQDLLTNRQWQPLTGGTTNAVPSPPIRGTGKWPRKKKETVARKPRPKATPRKTSGKPSGDILLTVNAMVDRYLPSVAAHLLPLQSTALADAGTSSLKRKRPVDQASESARPQRQRKKVDKDFELVPLSITRAPRSGQTNQPQTYQQQMSSIVRHTPGVYLGMECKLYQPGKSGAKRKSRLLILRFSCSQLLSDVCLQSSPAQDTPLAQSEMLQQCMTEMADNGGASQTPLEPIRHPSTQEREATIQKRRIIDDEASEDPIFPSNTPTTASPAAGSPSVPAYTLTSVETANSQSQMLPEGGSMFALHVGRDSSLPLPSRVVNPSQRKPILDCVSSDHRTFSEIQEGHSEAQKERSGDDSSTNNGKLKERQNAAHSNISTRPGSTDEETAQQRVPADLRVSPIEVQGDSANPPLPAAPSQNDPQTSFVGDGPSTDDRLALRRAVSTPLNNDQIRYSLNDGAEITKPTASGSSSTRKSPEAHSPSPLLSDLAHEPSKGSVLPVISEDTPRPKANTGVQKMTTKGGTVAALRRKIVMDIVERCGGLFPGASELGIPFQSEWIKSGRTGKVEKSTIRAVVKYLCDNGKLRQITFAIEEQGGGVTTKTIITKTEIGTTDPRVIRMRDAIIEAHPDLYLPDELEVPPRIRQGWNLKGRKMRTVKDLEVDQELVQLPTKPRDMQSHERKKEARKELEEYWDAVVRLIEANGGTLPEDKDIVDEDIKEFLYTTYAQRRLFVLSKKPAPVKSQRKVDRLASRIEGHADYQADRLRFIASPKEEALRRIAELTRKKTQRESEGDRNQNMAQGPKLPTYRRIEQGSSEARGIKRRRTQFNRVDMTLHSSAARQQMYTIMEPEHIFHPATGTFSVNFSRFRTPNQIMERYHWQRPANQYHAFSHSHGTMHFPPVKRRGPLEILRDLGALPSTKRRRSRTATDASSNPSRQASVAAATVTKQTTFSKPFKTRQLTAVEKITLPTKGRAALNASARSETDGINHRKKREPAPDPERARRIMTAVTVIRTLIGGIQQNIDWVLVAQALPPAYTQESINIEWEKVRKAYTNQVQQMESEFQALFLKAYSEDLVPPIDYDNLHAYDWAWLVEWTIENLGAPLDEGLSLPSERGRLHELFGLSTSEDPTLNNFYEFDTYLTIAKREADLHKRAWVRPLSRGLSKLDLASPKEGVIEVAKTWIRAVVVTKAEVYNAQFAADQLTRFDNSVQNQALTEMLADRVLMQENKGRIIPGRNYDLNEQYLRPLRKKIEAASFRKGPVFKQYIDEALAGGKEMIVPHMADDALAMAIFNMHAHHRVSLVAKNPPLEPWGLGGPEHYKTKEIDKKKFIFDVGLRATESYIYGNPLFPLPAPPAPRPLGPKDTATKLPLWVDLNGSVIPELWQLSLAATMSVLAMRPGASAKTLETSLKPCLGAWEIELLLVWMVDAHAAKRLEGGHGFLTAEWWWLCFGDGQEIEGRGDEQGDVQMGGT